MLKIKIDGKEVALVARQPLREGAQVVVQGVKLMMPPPLYSLQLSFLQLEKIRASGDGDPEALARGELDGYVTTLRRNYPDLPDAWVGEWDTADIWRIRLAYAKASQPPAEEGLGEGESR